MPIKARQANMWQESLVMLAEGHLFLHFYVLCSFDQVAPCVDYYVIRRGIVYHIDPHTLVETASGDDVVTAIGQAMNLGLYDSEKIVLHEFRFVRIPDMIEELKRWMDETKHNSG